MEFGELFQRLAIALGLGLIVGLQRERTGSPLAGFRTFPLITVFGALAGLLGGEHGAWVIAAGLLALSVVIVVGNLQQREESPGITTEMAMLVMYAVGAYIAGGQLAIAVVLGGTVAVLLHLKPQMHSVARRLEDPDFKAIMQFVLITLVILPILPNKAYGPFQVFNPFKIWLMVVLIVGISVGGYIIYKFFGQKAGTVATGILGGMISSTATTVSCARRSRENPQTSETAAVVVMLASTIVFARVLILIGASAPAFLRVAAGPIGLMFVAMLALALFGTWRRAGERAEPMPHGNPSELRAALLFGALYALVLYAAAAAKAYFGAGGLFVVAVLSGLTDMDAITLSLSALAAEERLDAQSAWRLILVAALSNLIFKTAMVAILGGRQLLKRIALLFGLSFAAGLAIIFLWPGGLR